MNSEIAVVAIGYNRPKSLKRLLNILLEADYDFDKVDLIVSLDKSNYEDDNIAVYNNIEWPFGRKKILTYKNRLGLREHVLRCGDLTKEYSGIIMFEDDIIPSKHYYTYTKKMLHFYKDNENIGGISLYAPQVNEMTDKFFCPIKNEFDIYFLKSAQSWGQCWSKEMWGNFRTWYADNSGPLIKHYDMPYSIYNWSDKSWKKYFMKYLVEKNKYFIYPYFSLSTNTHELGTHVRNSGSNYQVPLVMSKLKYDYVPFSKGIKYDAFFEIEELSRFLLHDKNFNFDLENICIDLYGTKTDTCGKRFLLTMKKINAPVIKSYGLKMKPHEMNIIYNINGDDIFLYDVLNVESIDGKQNFLSEFNYYSYVSWKKALLFGIVGFKDALLRKIRVLK